MYRRTFPNEYFHIYSRGNHKQEIFFENRDYIRFLFLILFFQSPVSLTKIDRHVEFYENNDVFRVKEDDISEILGSRHVELINFALMPNHFHLTVFEKEDRGISKYMQRVLNGYTKYHNTKYEKSGHLFQGPFQARHIVDDNYLSYLSAYIHKNPKEICARDAEYHEYPWSSFQDYTTKNRWGGLLSHEIITSKFTSGEEYKAFVDNSAAKINLELS